MYWVFTHETGYKVHPSPFPGAISRSLEVNQSRCRGVAQLAEHLFLMQVVVGSNPTTPFLSCRGSQ